ncbi:MAG: ACP phosphodiesterase [Thiolinea sp.]
MNYLAHLSLARPDSQSLTGNLLGDFMKGVQLEALPVRIRNGVANHRAVDRFTDQHPAVLALKPLFNERYRRFSGIMIDISFDHFLTRHWYRFHTALLRDWLDHCYQGLLEGRPHMPPRMRNTIEHMVRHDWLGGYAELEQVSYALDRVAERIRFRNDFQGAGQEVARHYPALEQAFLQVYPALQSHVQQQALEQPSAH